jgi:hypothetical protein
LTAGKFGAMVRPVGKHDNRNSMKMKRRKGQVKKKARLKRQTQSRKVAAQGSKKATAPKKSAKAAAASNPLAAVSLAAGPPQTPPTGSAPIA